MQVVLPGCRFRFLILPCHHRTCCLHPDPRLAGTGGPAQRQSRNRPRNATVIAAPEANQSQKRPVTDQTHPQSIIPDVVDLIPALRAYARSLTRTQADASDLVQQTLLKALANVDKFQSGTRLRAWLFTILRNTFHIRSHIRARERTGVADCVSGEMSVQPLQEWAVPGRELMAAIDRLPADYRKILILVVMPGESSEDAARICRCAEGPVKHRVSRARTMVMIDLEGGGA